MITELSNQEMTEVGGGNPLIFLGGIVAETLIEAAVDYWWNPRKSMEEYHNGYNRY